jgi:hypothetical protein
MAYTRDDAVKFAEKYWNIPTPDGIFWLSNERVVVAQVRRENTIGTPFWKKAPEADGWMPFFVDDGKGGEQAEFRRGAGPTLEKILINPWAGIADCAHFLSQCLSAGGAKLNERGVPSLVNALQERSDTKTLCEKVTKDAGQRVVDSGVFKPGDMIGYFNVDPKGDYGGAKQYAHSGMYAGKIGGSKDGGITCHTICRFPGKSWVEDSWWLKPPGHYTYTFIHFSSDDPPPDAIRLKALAGWWQLDYAGRTEFYLVDKNGTAKYSKRAPAKGQATLLAPEGSAHWFMAADGKITFIWRTSGTVEVWTPDGGGYKSMVNGVTPGTLTQLP